MPASSRNTRKPQAQPPHIRRQITRSYNNIGAPKYFTAIIVELLESGTGGIVFCCPKKHGLVFDKVGDIANVNLDRLTDTLKTNETLNTLVKKFGPKPDPMASFLRQCQLYLISASHCDQGRCVRRRHLKLKPTYGGVDIIFKFPHSINLLGVEGRNKLLSLKSASVREPEDNGRSLLSRQIRHSRNEREKEEREKEKENKRSDESTGMNVSAFGIGKGKFKIWEDPPEPDGPDAAYAPDTTQTDSSDLSEDQPTPSISKSKRKKKKIIPQPNNFRMRVEADFERRKAVSEAVVEAGAQAAIFKPLHAPNIAHLGITISEEESARQLERLMSLETSNTHCESSGASTSTVVDNLENIAHSVDMIAATALPDLPPLPTLPLDGSFGVFPNMYENIIASVNTNNTADTVIDHISTDIGLDALCVDMMGSYEGIDSQIVTRQQRRDLSRMGDTQSMPFYNL